MIECPFCHGMNPTSFCTCPLSPTANAKQFFPQWAQRHIVRLPDFPLGTNFSNVPRHTKYRIEWQCGNCTKTFQTKGNSNASRLDLSRDEKILCLTCWRELNPRKHASMQVSRFELEILAYLQLMLSKPLEVEHSYPLLDVARNKHRIDFYVPSLKIGVEIDPYYFHNRHEDKDKRIFDALSNSGLFSRVYRLRDHRLIDATKYEGYLAVSSAKGATEPSSQDFASAFARLLSELTGIPLRMISEDEARGVRVGSKKTWLKVREQFSVRKPLMDRQGYQRPEREQQCVRCGTSYPTRNKRQQYCGGECAARAREDSKRSVKVLSSSLAIDHPEVAANFIQNFTRPGVGPEGIAKSSNDYCEFLCSCGYHAPRVRAGIYAINWYKQHQYTKQHSSSSSMFPKAEA
jgi:hypothetical protein